MKRYAVLVLLLTLAACTSPENRRAAELEAEGPAAALTESMPAAGGEGGDWFSSTMEDMWRDSVAGWSTLTRSISRNTERDWARITRLFD